MTKFVALLRGINVGGHKKVSMSELKKIFERHGFSNVKTLLASGNVIFEGEKVDSIKEMIEKAFGFTMDTIILPQESVRRIVISEPFKAVKITPKMRLYVTFLKEKPKTKLQIPYYSEDNSFNILKITDEAIYSVLDLEKTKTTDAMNILEKKFGKNITTRNYNTVVKIAELK